MACAEVKGARERALVPDVFDMAAGQVDRSEAEIALRSSETCCVHTSLASTFNGLGDSGRGRLQIGAVAAERLR